MKILVTGAGGFVGKRLVAQLTQSGHDVTALLHSPVPPEDEHYFDSGSVRRIFGDLETLDPVTLPGGIEGMVMLAQSAHFRDFPAKARQVFEVNVAATFRLLDWARRECVQRVIVASSGGIYGGKLGGQFHETDGFATSTPLGFYLGSKACSEIVAQNYQQFFETLIILRPFFIYGPKQRADMFVTRIMHNVRDGREITLNGFAGLRVNPIYVDDAVNAFAVALERTGNRVVNIAGPDVVSLREMAVLFGARFGREPLFRHLDGDPIDYVADISVARTFLGLEPRSFADGIADTFATL
jgi:nucleoside-diphosphate-sugar epimerase